MNLELVQEAEAVAAAEDVARRLGDAVCVPAGPALPPRVPGIALHALVDAFTPAGADLCRASDGAPARSGTRPLACPHDPLEAAALDARVQAAARLPVDGLVLDRPDAWFAAGPRGAGFCASCEAKLNAELARQFGPQYVPYPVMRALTAAGDRDEPAFWREHALLRLQAGIEHGARLTRRVRDEVRRVRGETSVGAVLASTGPAAVRLAEKLDLVIVPAPVPSPAHAGIARYELFRGAMPRRAIVGLLDGETARRPGLVAQAARLASMVHADVALPQSAAVESHAALQAHRAFWSSLRTRYRPPDPFAEVLVLYSPECDHHTRGAHGHGVHAAAEALTAIGAQYRIVLETPRIGTEPLILADASALPEEEAARVERRVAEGSSAVVIGECRAADELGRPLAGPLDEVSDGLNKAGTGTAFGIDTKPEIAGPAERRFEPLMPALDRALESLLGRGRRAVGVNGASLVVKLFLDPDRKLDVQLVARAFDAATGAPGLVRGAVLFLSGAVVSGARSAYLFRPGTLEKRVALVPYGMGVQAALPDFDGDAVLVVDR